MSSPTGGGTECLKITGFGLIRVSPVMFPSFEKHRPLDIARDFVRSVLFPPSTEKSASFPNWRSPRWGTVREIQGWLSSKRNMEGAEGLWRVGDGIYDLEAFAKVHPGGRSWIELTKGTDLTEIFYSYHVSDVPRQMLQQFYVRKATTPRNSPFTFHSDGFYEVLRKRVFDQIKHVPRGPTMKTKAVSDALLLLTLASVAASVRYGSHALSLVASALLCATTISAHNFFHQRDNWRMYYFQISGLSVMGWRISHAMSHHIFPNTQHDLEVAMFEPWLQWLIKSKNIFWRFISWVYSPLVYTLIFPMSVLIRWGISGHDGAPEALPLLIPATMTIGLMGSSVSLLSLPYWWALVFLGSSFFFGLVGLNAGHHHPENFHDGDNVRNAKSMDWGVYQMVTVKDRVEIRDSVLGMTLFGDHCIHHLFPTLDHAVLPDLYPVLLRTCGEFGLTLGGCSLWEGVKGQFVQLARERKLTFPSTKHIGEKEKDE